MKPLAVDSVHVYEVRPCKDRRGTDLISDVLPFGQFFMADQNAAINAISYSQHYSRSHDVVIRVYDYCDKGRRGRSFPIHE